MSKAGYQFECISPNVDEDAITHPDFRELSKMRARAKAKKILEMRVADAIVITSDQVLLWNGVLREKPKDARQIKEFLKDYHLYPLEAATTVVVTNTHTGRQAEGTDETRLYFRKIPEAVIKQIAADPINLERGGGFASEDPLLKPYVAKIEGDPDGFMGLPMGLLEDLIRKVSA